MQDFLCDLGRKSEALFARVAQAPAFQAVLESLAGDDVLLKLSNIEAISKMITTDFVYRHFLEQGVLQSLIELLQDCEDASFSFLAVRLFVQGFGWPAGGGGIVVCCF
eukprot:m.186168 g.186168  ORF g.186168 m.186168 type:complete len:108 (-) comp10525_c0_seq4:40-363(-)